MEQLTIPEQVCNVLWRRMKLISKELQSNIKIHTITLLVRWVVCLNFQRVQQHPKKGRPNSKLQCVSLSFYTRKMFWKWKLKSERWKNGKRLGDEWKISRLFFSSVLPNSTSSVYYRRESLSLDLNFKRCYYNCICHFYSDFWSWATQLITWKIQNFFQFLVWLFLHSFGYSQQLG